LSKRFLILHIQQPNIMINNTTKEHRRRPWYERASK